jgi:hypothetical protein
MILNGRGELLFALTGFMCPNLCFDCYKFGRQALTYRGTPEKQEIGSQEGLRGECIRPFKRPVVVLSGNLVLDKWRSTQEWC